MATKKFTKHAQRVFNRNPNVVRCTESKIIFTDEFAQRVLDELRNGADPFQVFTDNGFSVRILGKSRIIGAIGLWKSRFEVEDLPRRKPAPKEAKPVETAAERRQRNLEVAIASVDALIADPAQIPVEEGTDKDTITFAAIKKVFDSKQPVVVKDLCAHYGYPYAKYYNYLRSLQPKSEFVNILNPHNKRK